MLLSSHFSRYEFQRDGSVLPDATVVAAYVSLCTLILEPLREWAGEPVYVTSGYRSAEVNARIGSPPDSQHVASGDWCAADVYLENHPTMEAPFNWMRLDSNLLFDQIIREDGKYRAILHISWSKTPRREALNGQTFNQVAYTRAHVAPIREEKNETT